MHRLPFAAAAIAVLVLQSCASVEQVIIAEPGVTFSLPIGKTAAVSGSSTRITFREVSEDSRCPTSVVCVWQGAAKIELTVARNGGRGEAANLSLTPPNNEARLGDLVVRFVGLAPYPASPDPAPRQYVAELMISKPQ